LYKYFCGMYPYSYPLYLIYIYCSYASKGELSNSYIFNLVTNGKVYTVILPNAQSATTLPIIREKINPDSIVYTDTYHSYDVLNVSEFSHFASITACILLKINHINGIENFWNQAKRYLRKFNGIPKEHFELYLKKCEGILITVK
jgi:family transposase